MSEKTREKSLIKVNDNSLFYKIKNFFRKLFCKNNTIENANVIKNNEEIEKQTRKDSFMEQIKTIENDETRLLKLQKQYRSGEIREEDLTEEQVNCLCELYDKQIANLRKSNKIRKERLLKYRRSLQTSN